MPQKPTVDQDAFDKGVIKALHALQKLGFCRNVAEIERYLNMPKRTLYQVIDGNRGVAKLRRHKLMQFFVNNYNVNPKLFTNTMAPVFVEEPPTLEEQPEAYFNKSDDAKNVLTMGDLNELDYLRRMVAEQDRQIDELKKEIKIYRTMVERQLLAAPGEIEKGGAGSKAKSGHKTGQSKK